MKKEINIKKAESFAKYMTVTIVGTSDLVLNKMNAWTVRYLVSDDRKKTLASRNVWEDIITAAHWRDELPRKKPEDWSEQDLRDLLKNNAPCISAFGLKKSFGDAVVRAGLDKYKTKFDASVNIIANNNLIPIVFAQHCVDEKLMSPKKGAPVLARLNRFVGWSATFTVQYLETVYSAEQIADIINIAGFGIGIGSGRSSGYGRYELESKS